MKKVLLFSVLLSSISLFSMEKGSDNLEEKHLLKIHMKVENEFEAFEKMKEFSAAVLPYNQISNINYNFEVSNPETALFLEKVVNVNPHNESICKVDPYVFQYLANHLSIDLVKKSVEAVLPVNAYIGKNKSDRLLPYLFELQGNKPSKIAEDVAIFLIEKGADVYLNGCPSFGSNMPGFSMPIVNQKKWSALERAITYHYSRLIKRLYRSGKVNADCPLGGGEYTPLTYTFFRANCTGESYYEVFKSLLLSTGKTKFVPGVGDFDIKYNDPDEKTKQGRTILQDFQLCIRQKEESFSAQEKKSLPCLKELERRLAFHALNINAIRKGVKERISAAIQAYPVNNKISLDQIQQLCKIPQSGLDMQDFGKELRDPEHIQLVKDARALCQKNGESNEEIFNVIDYYLTYCDAFNRVEKLWLSRAEYKTYSFKARCLQKEHPEISDKQYLTILDWHEDYILRQKKKFLANIHEEDLWTFNDHFNDITQKIKSLRQEIMLVVKHDKKDLDEKDKHDQLIQPDTKKDQKKDDYTIHQYNSNQNLKPKKKKTKWKKVFDSHASIKKSDVYKS